jgi:uncharacterized protein (TIGR02266 family)
MAQNGSSDETRRHRRLTVRVLVDYRTAEGVRCDYATTLGAGGMFLETIEKLTKGQVVKLRFKLPGYETIHEIEGRVVWVRGDAKHGAPLAVQGVGIQFTSAVAGSKLARELEDYGV